MKLMKLFLCGIVAIASLTVEAQITYNNRRLSINISEPNTIGLMINEWSGMKWTCKGSNFLRIDVNSLNPRIAGTGNEIVFYNTDTNTYNSIQVESVFNHSDARAKTDVHTLSSGLNTVLQLRPVSYKWKQPESMSAAAETFAGAKASGDSVHVAYGPEADAVQFGFLAQEVEKVLPDVVKSDDCGSKMINYIAMIPLLVESIQELQGIIESQSETIRLLTDGQSQIKASASSDNRILNCSLSREQNILTVSSQLDSDTKDAMVVVADMAGNRIHTQSISVQNPTISKDVAQLQAGHYIVYLYINGNLTDSCRFAKN